MSNKQVEHILKIPCQKAIGIGLDKNLDCKRVKPLVSLNADIPVKHSDIFHN